MIKPAERVWGKDLEIKERAIYHQNHDSKVD